MIDWALDQISEQATDQRFVISHRRVPRNSDALAALAAITKNSASTDKAEPQPRFYITGMTLIPVSGSPVLPTRNNPGACSRCSGKLVFKAK